MYILALRKGSKVDIFYPPKNEFYEARVTEVVKGAGIHYLYANTRDDKGYVQFKDILNTWRPRLGKKPRVVEELLFLHDQMEKKTCSSPEDGARKNISLITCNKA